MPLFAHVALPLPVPVPYSYAIPEGLADRVVAGARVVVPVRRREMVGIVVAVNDVAPAVPTRDVLAAPDATPALPDSLLKTAQWMAGYYGSPIGVTLKAMLPSPLWGESEVVLEIRDASRMGGTAGELLEWLERHGGRAPIRAAERALKKPLWSAADRLVRVGALAIEVVPPETDAATATYRAFEIAGEPLGLLEREERFAKRPRQRALYEALEQAAAPLAVEHLRTALKFSPAVIAGLVEAGLARPIDIERYRDPFKTMDASPPPGTLSAPQREAVTRLEALEVGQGAVVFGVTGSGKTLVYLEAIRRAVESGLGAIILVPEIGLTPQTVSRVRGMFGDQVAVLHSALSEGERADAWRALRRGDRRVAVGPRSAVFAPVSPLGFVVVDEEHEATYKNGEAPRYHARDVARVRCRLEGARLVLGSATPSLETAADVLDGRLSMVRLPERIEARPLPPVELIDMRTAERVKGVGGVPWSVALDDGLRQALARGEQALLLLNRRGFAAFLQCPDCGAVRMCPHCSISLTLHRSPAVLKCHYCGFSLPAEPACSSCGHPVTRALGIGTQQVEQVVAERIPGARIARMDLDTTGAKWSHHKILDRVGKGEVDVLVGTQMVAKGIDFPNVTMVGVVDADTGLHLPDFRSAERTFQLITQVAGRAGRGPKGGRVLVQTRSPDHPALRFAAKHDTEGFWAAERAGREDPPYPPATALVNIVVSGTDPKRVAAECSRVTDWIGALVSQHRLPVVVLGPAPCPIEKVKDRFRWHLLLKGPDPALGRIVRYAAPRLEARESARVVIDRDPASVL